MKLLGKTAIVTGASSGMGREIAALYAREGAKVLAVARRAERLESLAAETKDYSGQIIAHTADMYDSAQVQGMVDAAIAHFGKLDILVNNAGILAFGELDALTMDDFDRTIAINVRSVFIASQQAARHMPDGGRIITIGSVNADRMPFQGGAVYAMSKSALVGLTKGLARDLGPRGITVNNVQPGPVDTDMNPAEGEMADGMRSFMALNRYGKDVEIASFVSYLAGPEAGYITGANLTIDGGFGA